MSKTKWADLVDQLGDKNTRELLELYVSKERESLEALVAGGSEVPAWVKHGLSLVQRPVDSLLRPEPIISVQPMPQPLGGIAFYRPRYGSEPECIIDALATLADPKAKNPYKKKRGVGRIKPGREFK